MSFRDAFLQENRGAVAIVSSVIPPDPSGQARVLARLMSGIPGNRLVYLTAAPVPDVVDASRECIKLSSAQPYFCEQANGALGVADTAALKFNNAAGWAASLLQRTQEITSYLSGRDIAIVIGCSGDPVDLLAACKAAELLSLPFVAYIFDDPVFQWENLDVLQPMARAAERLWSHRARAVIAPNETLAEDIRKRNQESTNLNLAIIRNPTFLIARPPVPCQKSPGRRHKIVYTGSVYHAQGDAFRSLLRALDLCGDRFELHVYSSQGQAHFDAEEIVGPHVVRHGYIAADDVAEVQASADVLFLPLSFSRIQEVVRSSSPLKTGEYLQSRTPVLVHAPADTWISQFFRHHGCGAVVSEADPELLAAHLIRLVDDISYRMKLGAAQAAIAAQFDSVTVQEQFWGLLRAAVDRKIDATPMKFAAEEMLTAPSRSRAVAAVSAKRSFDSRRPKILFVAMQNSPHTARWIEMISDLGWDLNLFPLDRQGVNPNMCGVTVHVPQLTALRSEDAKVLDLPAYAQDGAVPASIKPFRVTLRDIGGVAALREGKVSLGEAGETADMLHGPGSLAALIREIQPDFIHSMEFQHAGYLVSKAKEQVQSDFPPWLATNWGSDIYHFAQFDEHRTQIERMLRQIDYYSCECHRDIKLAQRYGFRGPVMRVLPNTGGFDLEHIEQLRSKEPPSRRKRLMIKGYQHFAGRAMTSLAVLESIAEHLRDFEIILYSVSSEPLARAQQLISQGVLNIKIVGWATHDDMLRYFGSSRIYMGVSVSDAISTSVLEAMAMGAFPIQTNTACCDEWFDDRKSGFIVSPDDPDQIRDRLLKAIQDDNLVDQAEAINYRTVVERLDRRVLAPQVAEFYQPIFDDLRFGIEGESLAGSDA